METDFKVKMEGFEGPLEVLLDLIEKRKLHINDLSLSQIADDFINYTKTHEDFPMSDSADFILIASTLLLIKSKSLLPGLELTEDEKENIEDLEKRLVMYQKFKEIGLGVKEIFGLHPLYFASENKVKPVIFSPGKINTDSLLSSIQEVMKSVPKVENLPKVAVAKVVSLEEMIESLSIRVQKSIRTSFKDFAGAHKNDKVLVIVSFLAMLELVKQGIARVTQENHFDDINIEPESLGTPKY